MKDFIFPYINELSQSIDSNVNFSWENIKNNEFVDKSELKKVLLFAYSLNYLIKFPQIKEEIKPYMAHEFKPNVSRRMLHYLNLLPEYTENIIEFHNNHFDLLKAYSSFPVNYKKVIVNVVEKIEEHYASHNDRNYFNNWLINSKENILHLISSIFQRGIKIKKE